MRVDLVRAAALVEDDTLLVPSSDDVDEAYCEIQTEITQLEQELEKKLTGLRTELGYVPLSECIPVWG